MRIKRSMSEGMLQSFNINELAGATGLMLGGVGGLLAIIFKSRCYCKFRVGFNDKCSICMCERKLPPDGIDDEGNDKSPKKEKDLKKKDKEVELKDVESLIPPKKEEKANIKFDIDEKDNLM